MDIRKIKKLIELIEDSDINELEGLPEDLIELGKKQAEEEQIENSWLFKASRENLYPFLTFSNNRSLREKIYKGYVSTHKGYI